MNTEKNIRSKYIHWLRLSVIGILLIAGCDTALTVGSQTIGVSSGNFIYTDGYLMASYSYPIDKVWRACEQTLADMKATAVEKNLKIATGKIAAIAYDEKIQIVVEYESKNQSTVSVRVGLSGNNIASQLILDKITNNLQKPAIAGKK
jgi:Protein of unknown function (DUF3568)